MNDTDPFLKSSGKTDRFFLEMVNRITLETVLDIGAGSGKYGFFLSRFKPATRRTAIEIETSYITRYNLGQYYQEIRNVPATALLADVDASWDLVIIGDCIEHMRKSEGVDLLHFLVYRTKYIFIVYPDKTVQGSLDGVKSEAHMSVWSQRDFADFAGAGYTIDGSHALFLDGYRQTPSDPTVAKIMEQIQPATK